MASLINNDKGFKVIKLNRGEIYLLGGYGICDSCNTPVFEGYFVAVLNSWVCPQCYEHWLKEAVNYEEDWDFEERIFRKHAKLFLIEKEAVGDG